MAVFDGVCYSLSPSLSPTRRNELASVLDLNGAAPHTPYTHIIAPVASHNATSDPAVKLVTDRWVDRSIIMGKRQPEQYYSPDPAMIFSGVVACATDLSAADLEVLSAGITALGGQWRAGLTRDVTHLFALRSGSDKYNTALHFAPQTHMCILTPHWFDDAVRLGRRIPETSYTWPDPPVLRPGATVNLADDPHGTESRPRRKSGVDVDPEPGKSADAAKEGEQVHVWGGRRILLSISLELSESSRHAIEARIQRAGGSVVPISEDDDAEAEANEIDHSDVLVTRWRSGRSYFRAARASLLIGTLSWLFSVESSGTLHSPLDSLLWYPPPRGGISDLLNCEISITNYTGAARDYLKRLITLVGAKFTPSMSQSNKVLIAGFHPSPKTTRALSWSIPVVNHTWLEDCVVEWRALTVALERYIVYPPGIDFGTILMTRHDEPSSSQVVPAPRLSGGAVPGGRGIGTIDLEVEETRDAGYHARARRSTPGPSDVDGLTESRTRPRSRASSFVKGKSRSASTPTAPSATGAFVDHVIELPPDDANDRVDDAKQRTPLNGKQRARTDLVGSRTTPRSALRSSPDGDLFSTGIETEGVVRTSGGGSARARDETKGKGKGRGDARKQPKRASEESASDGGPSSPADLRSRHRVVQRKPNVQTTRTDDEGEVVPRRRADGALRSDAGEGERSEGSMPPRRPTGTGSKTPVKSAMKPRPRSQSQSRPQSVLDGESEAETRVVASKSEKAATETGGKRRKKAAGPMRNDRDIVIAAKTETSRGRKEGERAAARTPSPTRSSSPFSPSAKKARPLKRRLSVVVPSVPKEYFSSQSVREAESDRKEREGKERVADARVGSGARRKPLLSATSMEAVAAEASSSAHKQGKPSPAKVPGPVIVSEKSKSQPPAKAKSALGTSKGKTKPRAEEEEEWDKVGQDTSMIIDSPAASTSRGGPRRSAAHKATTRLREEVMPDVVSFEREQKQAKRRRSGGGESIASIKEQEVEEKRGGKRRKVQAEAEEEKEDVEDVVLVPSARAKSKLVNPQAKVKGTIGTGSDEEVENPPTKNKSNGAHENKSARGRGKELAAVRLMTTGVTLSDDVIKRLAKLGVQMTTRPVECTHLVAKGIIRTEKFLCAMSVSPHVLTEAWANASAKNGKLLPEKDYLLSDAAAEQRWSFKLADAKARAKGPDGGSNLFKQMTFYVTPKVSVDAKLLKAVIAAGGGQVQTSTMPTVRILGGKENRYVISCEEDRAIWRPLAAEGFRVYSSELLLRGALRQEIEWENAACVIAG